MNKVDLNTLSREELIDRKDELMEGVINMRAQIEFAEARAVNGEPVDTDWMIRAKAAKSHCAREVQMIDHKLSMKGSSILEKCFLDIARRRMDPEVFQEMFDEAREESEHRAKRGEAA